MKRREIITLLRATGPPPVEDSSLWSSQRWVARSYVKGQAWRHRLKPSRSRTRSNRMALSDKLVRHGRRAFRAAGLGYFVEPDIKQFPKQKADADNDLARIFYAHDGRLARKWHHYLGIYDRHLSKLRGSEIKFLEIGVSHGGSLQIWSKYFGPSAKIFGIDFDKRFEGFGNPPSINIRIGSQTDATFLRSVVREMGGVDVVLDDGSHYASHQRASFEVLFPLLSAKGLYIVEDLHTNYWRGEYEGGWRRRSTFVEYMKDVVDDLHGWWHSRRQRVSGAHQTIEAVHFYDSVIVVEKNPRGSPFSQPVGKPSFDDPFFK
jgi:cephalosporin hydroxylase